MRIQKSILAFLVIIIAGCTNTIYQAELSVLNSDDAKQKAVLYWSKTDKLVGESKAGPIVLMTACSTRRLDFVDTGSGVVFFGAPDMDKLVLSSEPVTQKTVCGQINDANKITDLDEGPLSLNINCQAIIDEFSFRDGLYSPVYIKASETPYRFEVNKESHWSFNGSIPDAPKPPECR
jgi:hypothetical protein